MKYNHDYKNAFRILKGGKISLVVSAFLAGSTLLHAAPSGGEVTSGSASISQSGLATNIHQSSNKASINWQSFNIAPSESVNFIQPSSDSITLNRVVGATNSLIQGAMNANGQVILVNPNGVVFSQGSQVNVGGLIATTRDISDQDFNNDNYLFEGDSSGGILNRGTINAKYVAMMGKTVANEGSIVATLGRVELAGGDKFTLNLNGDSLLSLRIDEGTLNALVENKGLIKADGGVVYLTTQALDSVLDGMVNNTGVIEAQSLSANENGEIVLFAHGGTANIGGEIKAEGGFVETSGDRVKIADDFKVTANDWLIDPLNFTISSGITAQSTSGIGATTLSNALATSNVTIQTDNVNGAEDGDIFVNSAISWTSDKDLTLNAYRNININADITATDSAAKLTLEYGQGTVLAGNTADYNIVRNVKISLKDGQNFTTKLGNDATIQNGGQVDYTVINSAQALQNIGTDDTTLAGHYALGSDVDLSNLNWKSIGTEMTFENASFDENSNLVGVINTSGFTGKFSGLGHKVNNLTMNNVGVIGDVFNTPANGFSEIGLFGSVYGGQIRDIAIDSAVISTSVDSSEGSGGIGVLAAFVTQGAVIKNVHVTNAQITSQVDVENDVYDGNIGGLVGYLRDGAKIDKSSAEVIVTGSDIPLGEGLVLGGRAVQVGGLVGAMQHSDNTWGETSITNSHASGQVTGLYMVGGLVGTVRSGGLIENSYSITDVTGISSVGGIVGDYFSATGDYNLAKLTLRNVFASGEVSELPGGKSGGLIGSIGAAVGSTTPRPADLTNAYWDSTTTGQQYLVHGGTETTGAIANADAYTQTSYANFDFTNDWFMVEGYTRPFLRMEWTPVISNAHQLQMMSSKLGSNNRISYTMINDINLAPSLTNKSEMWKDTSTTVDYSNFQGSWVAIGDGSNWTPFTANFDGLGHTVSNLFINSNQEYQGLFGLVQGTGSNNVLISNIGVTGQITGSGYVGGLVGSANYTTVTNSFADVGVKVNHWRGYAGGLIGYASGVNVYSSYATGDVEDISSGGDAEYLGGLIGYYYGDFNIDIRNSFASGNVKGGVSSSYLGGLLGYREYGNVLRSFATGNVTAGVGSEYLGGLIGYDDSNPAYSGSVATDMITKDVYATGNVTGGDYVGGLVAYADDIYIENAYSAGQVTLASGAMGTNIGGFIGAGYNGSTSGGQPPYVHVVNSFWDTQTSGQSSAGVLPEDPSRYGLTGITTAEMKTFSTYPLSGGEFGGWEIVTDPSLSNVYPQLRWATSGLENVTSVWVIGAYTPPPPPPPPAPSGPTAEEIAAEQEAARLAAIEAARIAAEQEAARLAAIEAARIAAEQEAARLAAIEAARIAAEQEAARLAAIEAARIAAEQEAARLAAIEAQRIAAEQEAVADDIVTAIVNNAMLNNAKPTTQLQTQQQNPQDAFGKRVESTLLSKAPEMANGKNLGSVALGLDGAIRSVSPAAANTSKDKKLTVVGQTSGETEITKIELDELLAQSGGAELRVALSPDSFIELVNGGLNLPDNVSQEFYVVEDKE